MVLRVGGAVHVVLEPKVELLRVEGRVAVAAHSLPLEVVAGGELQVCV